MRTGSAWIIEIVGLLGLLGAVSSAAAAPATVPPDAAEYFEKHVRPVLAQNCDTCHGEKMQMAGLRLDSLQAILKGGDSKHTILAPGDPAKSALIQAIEYTGDVKMPPPGKLSEADIQALTAWVKMGAPWPEEKSATGAAPAAYVPPAAAAKHWAFLPVHKPTIPTVKNRAWVKTPVDAFILAKLESKGLTPAKPADRRTLLRRVTFDLTGLPPTPEEMDAFLKDRSSGAYARVVDRLLASPHYGERWGRYWLDIARYSDTKGYVFVEDRSYPYAYTYRDWVIHAFNKDMPYDKFLMEQIAADQLPLSPDKHELAAMGFLTVGRRFLNNPPDIIDDRIDVVCRGMMALTVGCARCHDHKFDPIPQKDYYSLYGVFASSDEPKDLPVIAPRATQEAYTLYETVLKSREDAVTKYQADQKAALAAGKPEAQKQLMALQSEVASWKATPAPLPARAMVLTDAATPTKPHVFLRGNPNNPGPEVPRQFVSVIAGPNRKPFQHGSGRLELAQAIANKDNPLTARVIVNRIWLHHFGYGLVRTPSDFGMRADPPTHPELLDYLASRFVEDGWSIKKLQRLILLSSVYQQSSDSNPKDRKVDPENLLLAYMNRQRLDFEATRDSLLAACGQLDEKIGGPAVEITTAPYSHRRTVYGLIERQNLPGLFRTFDFATPDATSPQRHVTTVPQQALFMMNSPFVIEAARHLARLPEIQSETDPADRIRRLYRQLYDRAPTARELSLGLRFIQAGIPDSSIPIGEPSAWSNGYGEYDAAAGRVKSFHLLPYWSGEVWRGGKDFPDPVLSFLILTPTGGHPGKDLQHAAIRRWTAPRGGIIDITGTLGHKQKEGDGVQGRIVSSRLGDLGHWIVQNSKAPTDVKGIAVQKGDTIDFVVDCRADAGFDSFTWAPSIHLEAGKTTLARNVSGDAADRRTEWSAGGDFSGPPPSPAERLGAWEKYTQVLLMANEFVFVD